MKKNQKGFSAVEGLLILIIVGLLGFVGWYVWNSNNKAGQQTLTKQASEISWKEKSIKLVGMTFKAPSNWQDISDNTKFKDSKYKYEEIKLKSPDNFVLSLSANNLPRGYESPPDFTVLEVKNIDASKQYIITDNGDGKVSRIYVGSGDIKVGEKIVPIPRINSKLDGVGIEIFGAFEKPSTSRPIFEVEYPSLAAFNQEKSVKEAKQILESIKFSN
ncbi:hypothetical protein HYW35_02610 [Candidatus Saccharibacteria bacterium]|nr:hypothetical protein [Candidatus Saccharibacteria bacterium]